MPDLNFKVEQIIAEPFAATPTLDFKIRIDQAGEPLNTHAIALRCQVRIEPNRRKYSSQQAQRLHDLFGKASQWSQTLRSMLWTHTSTIVPAFNSTTVASLPVPCTFDFNVATTKYFDALDDGEIHLTLLFSGTIFYQAEGGLQTSPISWDKEATAVLPAQTWRDMMNQHYPNSAWLCLSKDTFDRLQQFKSEFGYPTWESALDELLTDPSREAAI